LPSAGGFGQIAAMKQQILVVDDEAPILELLSAYFKKHGYDVSSASNAADALRLIEEKPPHLVILDVLLADTDGLEVLSQIKSARPKLPVIIMTGIGFDEELLQDAVQKGAAGYVSKTLPLDQLLMEVHRILNYPH
jgi:DNA-binding NtrC family response regulator